MILKIREINSRQSKNPMIRKKENTLLVSHMCRTVLHMWLTKIGLQEGQCLPKYLRHGCRTEWCWCSSEIQWWKPLKASSLWSRSQVDFAEQWRSSYIIQTGQHIFLSLKLQKRDRIVLKSVTTPRKEMLKNRSPQNGSPLPSSFTSVSCVSYQSTLRESILRRRFVGLMAVHFTTISYFI